MSSAPANRSKVYVIPQASAGTEPAFDLTKSVRVVICETAVVHEPIKRESHDQPNDGGLKPLASGRYRTWKIVLELKKPTTAGTATTLQAYHLLRAAPVKLTDLTGPSRITITPLSGRVPFLDFVPVAIYKYEANGRKLWSLDTVFTITDAKADPNGTVILTLDGMGTCEDDENFNADDVAQIYTYTVTGAAAGNWSVKATDERGRTETIVAAGDAANVNDCATALRANLTAGSPTLFTVSGATDAVVLTAVEKGRLLTFVVTPAGSGTGSGSITTPRVNRSERPTLTNDDGGVCVFLGATITDSRGSLQQVGAFSLTPGVALVARPAAEGTHGYGMARHGGGGYATLSISHDVQPFADFDAFTPFVDQTAESITLATADFAVACPQVTVGSSSETTRESDRGYDETLLAYSTGNDTDHWSITLY